MCIRFRSKKRGQMSNRLIDEVRRERPDLANDPDALHAEVECRLREVEGAIGRLNKVADVMRQLERREAAIVYDPQSDSVDIVVRRPGA